MPAVLMLMNPSPPPYRLRGSAGSRSMIRLGSKVKAAIRKGRHQNPSVEEAAFRDALLAELAKQPGARKKAKRKPVSAEVRRAKEQASIAAIAAQHGYDPAAYAAFRRAHSNFGARVRAYAKKHGVPWYEALKALEAQRPSIEAVRLKNPSHHGKDSHMAKRRRKKNPMMHRYANPTKKGNLTSEEKRAELRAAGISEARIEALLGKGRKPAAGKPAGRTREQFQAERRAAREAAVAAAGGEKEYQKLLRASAGERRKERYASIDQAVAAFQRGELSRSEYASLIRAARAQRGQKPRRRIAKVMKIIRSGKPTKSTVYLFGPRHEQAFGLAGQKRVRRDRVIKSGKNKGKVVQQLVYPTSAALARSYLSVKRQTAGLKRGTADYALAKNLGLLGLPNANWTPDTSIKGAALAFGYVFAGAAAVGVALRWVLPMVKSRLSPALQPYVVPVGALAVGLGGGALAMKMKSPAAKWIGGAMFIGGTAVAAFKTMEAVKIGGQSMASFVDGGQGILSMGDYHMGMRVGDYHMGGEVAKLNVGDYHMGQIDVVTDRRMLAPPGEPMPRHDTRRDNVDESITAFTGSLAGDIFDA